MAEPPEPFTTELAHRYVHPGFESVTVNDLFTQTVVDQTI